MVRMYASYYLVYFWVLVRWLPVLATGDVRAEDACWRISWSALLQEAGKLPTEVTRGRHVPMSPPSAISEYASPSSCSWSLNYALLETGADKVVHHQGARARRAPQSTY